MRLPSNLNLVQRCANIQQLQQIHARVCINGEDKVVGPRLATRYIDFGDIDNALLLLCKNKNAVSLWNTILRTNNIVGNHENAIELYNKMQRSGTRPDSFIFNTLLKIPVMLLDLKLGQCIHLQAIKSGLHTHLFVANVLLSMYCKCHQIEMACHVFDKMPVRDTISWNAMISGYANDGPYGESIAFFHEMKKDPRLNPDSFTYSFALKACAETLNFNEGERIHEEVVRNGFESDVYVGNSLIVLYSRCGDVESAVTAFNKIICKDVVSWNSMIGGYAQNGFFHEAISKFSEMIFQSLKPTSVSICSVVRAFADMASLQQAKCLHGLIIKSGFECNVCIGSALIDLYAKCGSVEIARQVFDEMPARNVVSWSAMIDAYGMYGLGREALEVFQQMDTLPDYVTFVCVLSACSHAGLVEEGCRCFRSMSRDYKIEAREEHYACTVDLLGRAGRLMEARELVESMPFKAGVNVWCSLLGACRIHGNISMAEEVAKVVFEMDPNSAGRYVLLSNIYADAGRWDDVIKVRTLMKQRKVKKKPGSSLIEVKSKVHEFLVGDKSHPESEKIYDMLEKLYVQMRDAGFVADTKFVLHDVEAEGKTELLNTHSEKLAIAYGIISTPPGTPIRITKNLRVCRDCHTATKFICKIVSREIIVRDATRFHIFKDGSCSCGDYW